MPELFHTLCLCDLVFVWSKQFLFVLTSDEVPLRQFYTSQFPSRSIFFCVFQFYSLIPLLVEFPFVLLPPPPLVCWSDGMRCCRSERPELCLFCCYQPLCVVSHRVDLGFFFFHKLSNFTPIAPALDTSLLQSPSFPPLSIGRGRQSNAPEMFTEAQVGCRLCGWLLFGPPEDRIFL